MRETRLTLPELGLIAVTRGMLGAGIGLLVSPKMRRQPRLVVGIALAAIGALSTIPFVLRIMRRRRELDGHARPTSEAAIPGV